MEVEGGLGIFGKNRAHGLVGRDLGDVRAMFVARRTQCFGELELLLIGHVDALEQQNPAPFKQDAQVLGYLQHRQFRDARSVFRARPAGVFYRT